MSDDAGQTLGLAIKGYRARLGLTQETLAERSGISARSISDLERGISRAPHKDTLALLAAALQLTPDEAAQLVALASPAFAATTPPGAGVPLFGRERELRAIQQRLGAPATRLLTLTGVAGVGKTRLAQESAQGLRTEFRDDVTFVDLAALQAARHVMPTIARELGAREQPGQTPLATVVAALADRQALLVLDNCEHVFEARPEIAALLTQAPRLAILATSRERLGLAGEQTLAVAPLATPDPRFVTADAALLEYPAIALFLACVRALQADYAPPPLQLRAIAMLCAMLEGIPLAIALAAARVPEMPPRAILAQLAGAGRRGMLGWLRHPAQRLPARHQTLRDALTWSYRRLTAREQIVFRRLSVFVDGWTLDAAEALDAARGPTGDLPAVLTSLVEKSLVLVETAADGAERFRLHFVVRAFAAELLAERHETAATERAVAEYYAALVERLEQDLTGATQAASLHRLIAEYANIRAALQWARARDAVVLGLRIVGALWWFWENRGDLTEGREWLEGVLALWEPGLAGVDDETVARAYYGATILAISQGDTARGETLAAACLARLHAPAKRARVLLMRGNLAKRRGSAAEALDYYTAGLATLRALQDVKGLLVALNNLSTLAIERGDLTQALTLLDESLALKRGLGDRRGVAVGLMNLGEVLKMQGDLRRARTITAEGLAIFADLGDIQGIAVAYNNLGEIAEAQGDDTDAGAAYAHYLAFARRMEDRPGVAQALLRLGQTLARQRDPQALDTLQEAAALFDAAGDVAGIAAVRLALAAWYFDTGAHQAARDELQRLASSGGALPEPLRARYVELAARLGLAPESLSA